MADIPRHQVIAPAFYKDIRFFQDAERPVNLSEKTGDRCLSGPRVSSKNHVQRPG